MDLSSTFGPKAKNIQFVDDDDNKHKDKQKKYFEQCIRFCFAYLNEEQIRDGVTKFVESIMKIIKY